MIQLVFCSIFLIGAIISICLVLFKPEETKSSFDRVMMLIMIMMLIVMSMAFFAQFTYNMGAKDVLTGKIKYELIKKTTEEWQRVDK